ncbi:alkaline phosphatase [Pseudoalteromonas rubra]|uniref:Alkaline phosphatase n=1 Tax=Pseudoalteromonas rubra TaxID=43658 RepID=A0A5S3WVS7_9GAMM|nr:alkaline phosphatase [Pseudoalteromonas rubra]TMP31698.1 alkaline phosphatase [Pseudoalteromonas rubra]TMP33220.1 alkaline phosphatase [Pseudoalteromonas rubra]
MIRKISTIAFALGCTLSNSALAAPKNVIYMIGDGMGPAFTTAYRYMQDNKATKVVEPTVFDSILVGMAHTYPDDDTVVTDSAAGATALSTASKSYNGAIAVDTHKHALKTMLEMAKERGMTTALVATSQINHATPASFAAHNESRRNYDEIADDYIDNKIAGKLPVDLMLGGGTKYFIRDDRNLVNEFKQAGYQYTDSFNNLNSLQRLPALGLFAEVAFPHAIDSEQPNRLTTMTDKTLSLLHKHNEAGFFVMIEGSQIDWCGHANDIACAMKEMDDFAGAVSLAKAYVDANPDTLLVVTADHSTGGLTLGSNGVYEWKTDVVAKVKASVKELTNTLYDIKPELMASSWSELTGLPFDKETKKLLTRAQKESKEAFYKAANKLINDASYTGWTTKGHTAIDVQIFAYGEGRDAFIGSLNNTQIADKLISYIAK